MCVDLEQAMAEIWLPLCLLSIWIVNPSLFHSSLMHDPFAHPADG